MWYLIAFAGGGLCVLGLIWLTIVTHVTYH